MAAAVLLVIAAPTFTGCHGSPDAGQSTEGQASATTSYATPAPTETDPGPPTIADRCDADQWGGLALRERRFDASDGTTLFAVDVGTGPRGIVLLPGTSSAGACNWARVAHWLVEDGYHVLAIDHRCQGFSDCPDEGGGALDVDVLAAASELRQGGARTVVVVGESRGGGVALVAPVRPDATGDARLDAVVSVSGVWFEGTYTGPRPAPVDQLVGRLAVPALYLSARDDSLVDQRAYRAWASATPVSAYAVWARGGHGAAMLGYDRPAAPYRRMEAFIRAQSAG